MGITLSESKLGSHIDQNGWPGQFETIRDSGCRVVFNSAQPHFLADMQRQRPDIITVGRDWKYAGLGHPEPSGGFAGDDFLGWGIDSHEKARQAAYEWVQALKPTMQVSPHTYWHAVNEPAFSAELPLLATFEAERQRIMHEEGGWKAAIFNFPVGTPRVDAPDDEWERLYPALEACHQYGNLLSLHEYFPALPYLYYGSNQAEQVRRGSVVHFPTDYDDGWLMMRYRKVWRLHIEPQGWANIRIVIKEFGSSFVSDGPLDAFLGRAAGAWRGNEDIYRRTLWNPGVLPPALCNLHDTYMECLKWVDAQWRNDPYVVGGCCFCDGTIGSDWGDFDIAGTFSNHLYTYVASQR